MSRRAGYYYRYRPRTSVNQALNTITRRAKTAEKQNHKRGIYKDEFSQYMHENVVITTFNNCLVCMRFANKSYIGRAACNMLEAQLQYANGMSGTASSSALKLELARMAGYDDTYRNSEPTPNPAINQSYGLVPYERQGVYITNSEHYWENLLDFMTLNVFSVSSDKLNKFFDQKAPDISIRLDNGDEKYQPTNFERLLQQTLAMKKMIKDTNQNVSTMVENDVMTTFKAYTREFFRDFSWEPDYRDFLGSWSSLRRSSNVIKEDDVRYRQGAKKKLDMSKEKKGTLLAKVDLNLEQPKGNDQPLPPSFMRPQNDDSSLLQEPQSEPNVPLNNDKRLSSTFTIQSMPSAQVIQKQETNNNYWNNPQDFGNAVLATMSSIDNPDMVKFIISTAELQKSYFSQDGLDEIEKEIKDNLIEGDTRNLFHFDSMPNNKFRAFLSQIAIYNINTQEDE